MVVFEEDFQTVPLNHAIILTGFGENSRCGCRAPREDKRDFMTCRLIF